MCEQAFQGHGSRSASEAVGVAGGPPLWTFPDTLPIGAQSFELAQQQQQAILSDSHAAATAALMLAAGQQSFPFYSFQQLPTHHLMQAAFAAQQQASAGVPNTDGASGANIDMGQVHNQVPGTTANLTGAPLPSPGTAHQHQLLPWTSGPLANLFLGGGPGASEALAAAFPAGFTGQFLPNGMPNANVASASGLFLPMGLPMHSGAFGLPSPGHLPQSLYPGGIPDHLGGYLMHAGLPTLPGLGTLQASSNHQGHLGGGGIDQAQQSAFPLGLASSLLAPVGSSSIAAAESGGLVSSGADAEPASSRKGAHVDGHVHQALSALGIAGRDVQMEEGAGSQVEPRGPAVSQQAASIALNDYHAVYGGGASSLAGTPGVAASGYMGADAPAGASVQGNGGGAFAAAAFDDANSNIAAAPQAANFGGDGGMRSNSVASRPLGLQHHFQQHFQDGSNGYSPMHHDFGSHMHAAMSLMFQATSRVIGGPSHNQHQSQLQQAQHQQHGGYSAGPSRMANSVADLQTSHVAADHVAETGPQVSTSLIEGARGSSHYHRNGQSPAHRQATDTNSPASIAESGGRHSSRMGHDDDAGHQHGSTLAVSLGDDGGVRSCGDDEVAGRQQEYGIAVGDPGARQLSLGAVNDVGNPGPPYEHQRRGRGTGTAAGGATSYSRSQSRSHMQSNGPRGIEGETSVGRRRSGTAGGIIRGEEAPQRANASGSQQRSMSDIQQDFPGQV